MLGNVEIAGRDWEAVFTIQKENIRMEAGGSGEGEGKAKSKREGKQMKESQRP